MADDLIEIELPDGTKRRLGNNSTGTRMFATAKTYGDTPDAPMIPRSQWKPVSLERFLPPVYDQDGVGACNAFATITCAEACRAMQGLPYIPLSPGWLYGRINGGRDQGSMLEDALEHMMTVGTCTVATVDYLAWRDNPVAAKAEAPRFKFLEAFWCPTFDHMASAIMAGFFVDHGLMWKDGFKPDGDGWISGGSGRGGGHALCGYGLANRNGKWGIPTRNSWSPRWGVNGNCILAENVFGREIGGVWAVRSVVDEGGVVPAES